ncbi:MULTISPECIES: hypothetical protein [Nocardiopsis]|uniref:hypothetical protein n=1 Tax=Nocardiopsis TaxID=2013 RepID=UPI000345055A|nr:MULTISPECIES: hypothetical protein [Nocardiopsis]PWV45712.1 hypothetical protein BDW27_11646 [Nocardiopsis sp. L17-MgMaSL7]
MIIWRGWGILVLLIAAAIAVPCGIVAGHLMGSQASGLGGAVGCVLAAVAVYFVGQRLNAPKQAFDPATGQPVRHRNAHTLFFVPMQYWAFILPVVAVGIAATAFPL